MLSSPHSHPPVSARLEQLRSELAHRIAACIGSAQRLSTPIPSLTLHRRTAPTPPCAMTYEPSLIFTVQGRKRVELGGKSFSQGPSEYLLASVALPVVAWVAEATDAQPCLALTLKLQMPVIRELLGREEIPPPQPRKGPAIAICQASEELFDALARLLRLLDRPEEIAFLSGLIEREIIFRVLRSPEGARLRSIATLGDQSQRTARAIAWIKDNFAKPLRVEDLAEIAGMGVSTLHHHFRALTAMSPLQYQKQVRLQEARNRLSVGGLDVGSAALEVGYESASQFTREYKRLFGSTPLRDARALRGSVSADTANPRPVPNPLH